MLQFTKESIESAINRIDSDLTILKGRESKDYDLLLADGRRYPPILVLSEAHKFLGGEELVVNDFNNSTKKPFKILRGLGYEVVNKNIPDLSSITEKFNYNEFVKACAASNLIIPESLAIRFVAALITKPFVILTGLSGSGKTKLALAFANWITNSSFKSAVNRFFKGEEIKSDRVTYLVTDADTVAATFTQSDSGTKVTLPYELIDEWIQTISALKYTEGTAARDIRESVKSRTKYSSQLNSFETHLKAAAFHLLSKQGNTFQEASAVCILPVGADWTNREPLLGYANSLLPNTYVVPENGALQLIISASRNPSKPHFLILDEMNLSHVERYFADFLSSMESKQPIYLHSGHTDYNFIPSAIALPENLFIIGTVNIDETTYMFSPKVLDRANVIEFRVEEKEMRSFLSGNTNLEFDKLTGKGVSMASDFLLKSQMKYGIQSNDNNVINELVNFFRELKAVGAEFGYRTASEIFRFIAVTSNLNSNWTKEQIFDAAIIQKLLPKLHGSRRKLELPLKALAELCLHDKTFAADCLNPKKEIDFTDKQKIKFPLSLEKLRRMNNSLIHNNFASYAEA